MHPNIKYCRHTEMSASHLKLHLENDSKGELSTKPKLNDRRRDFDFPMIYENKRTFVYSMTGFCGGDFRA